MGYGNNVAMGGGKWMNGYMGEWMGTVPISAVEDCQIVQIPSAL